MARGDHSDAIHKLKLILFADRSRVDAWVSLGLAHATSGNCDEARNAWQTALELRPDDKAAAGYLAGLCTDQAG